MFRGFAMVRARISTSCPLRNPRHISPKVKIDLVFLSLILFYTMERVLLSYVFVSETSGLRGVGSGFGEYADSILRCNWSGIEFL